MQKLLFIGGSSFFGKETVKKLLAQKKYAITLLTRGNNKPVEFRESITFITCDRRDPEALKRALQGQYFDIVVDNIAMTQEDIKNILDILRGKIGHYLMCSTGAVYPSYSLHEWDEDEAVLSPIPGQREYANHKREAEAMLRTYSDIPFTIYRPTVVEGPEDTSRRTFYFINKINQQMPFFIPDDVLRRHVYVEDIAEVIFRLINLSPTNMTYNISGDDKLTLQAYCDIIAQSLGKASCYQAISRDEFLARNIQDIPVPYQYNNISANARIKQKLGLHFSPIEKWLPITVAWYMQEPNAGEPKVRY